MNRVLLISTADVIKYTALKGNIDSDQINPHIITVQDLTLAYILGDSLMQKLIGLIESKTIDDVGNVMYKTLLEKYVRPFLCHAVCQKTLEFLGYTLGSGGISTRTQEQGVPAQGAEYSAIYGSARSQAQQYQRILVDWLCANGSKINEYNESNNGKQSKEIGYDSFTGWETY